MSKFVNYNPELSRVRYNTSHWLAKKLFFYLGREGHT